METIDFQRVGGMIRRVRSESGMTLADLAGD